MEDRGEAEMILGLPQQALRRKRPSQLCALAGSSGAMSREGGRRARRSPGMPLAAGRVGQEPRGFGGFGGK